MGRSYVFYFAQHVSPVPGCLLWNNCKNKKFWITKGHDPQFSQRAIKLGGGHQWLQTGSNTLVWGRRKIGNISHSDMLYTTMGF